MYAERVQRNIVNEDHYAAYRQGRTGPEQDEAKLQPEVYIDVMISQNSNACSETAFAVFGFGAKTCH